MNFLKSIFSGILLLIIICGCKMRKTEKRRIKNDIVEAEFDNSGKINGFARFYSLSGVLEFEGTFNKGEKNGTCKTFYDNQKVQDSMYFINDLLHGSAYKFAPNGQLQLMRTNYYGIEIGDHLFYENGKLLNYSFDNFEGIQLVKIDYDSLEHCETLRFNAKPIVNDIQIEGGNLSKRIFIYFPHPPHIKFFYKLFLTDKANSKKEVLPVNSDRLFLDTTLKIFTDKEYFLSIDFKEQFTDTTANVILQKL